MTPAEIKEVWDATPNPTGKKVAELIRQAGGQISANAVYQLKNNNWVETPRTAKTGAKASWQQQQAALRKMDMAVSAFTRDPKSRLRDVVHVPSDVQDYMDAVETKTVPQIREEANKCVGRAVTFLADKLVVHYETLICKPAIFNAVWGAIVSGTNAINAPGSGNPLPGVKMLEVFPPDNSETPARQKLKEFLDGVGHQVG